MVDVMTGIIVGLDGSSNSTNALRWAAREGSLRKLPVEAVLAWSLLDQHHVKPDEGFNPHYLESDAARALKHYVDEALGEQASGAVKQTVVCDLPARALLQASASSDLLVVGARGRDGFKGLLFGSVAQQCLAHRTGPIAIIRDSHSADDERSIERIVVGVDGSENSIRALRWASTEAQLRDAELHVVHAWHTPYWVGYPDVAGAYDPTPFEEAAVATLDGAIHQAGVGGLTHPVKRTISTSGAAKAILAAAEDADLVVVGTRGLGGFTGLLLGSIGHQIAHHATCPVVLIPSAE